MIPDNLGEAGSMLVYMMVIERLIGIVFGLVIVPIVAYFAFKTFKEQWRGMK